MQPTIQFFAVNNDTDFLPSTQTAGAVGYDCKADVFRVKETGFDIISTEWNETVHTDGSKSSQQMTKVKTTLLIPLGIKAIIPAGYWLEIRPRSSFFAKKGFICLDGVIDEDYTGEIMLAVSMIADEPFDDFILKCASRNNLRYNCDRDDSLEKDRTFFLGIENKERIAQLILHKKNTFTVESVTEEEFEKLAKEKKLMRNADGFGTTGK